MGKSSGIGVLDKAVQVLRATTVAPTGLADLCAATGLPRATAHRLAVGLEVHGLLARDANGRWCPGPLLAVLAAGAPDPLVSASRRRAAAAARPHRRERAGLPAGRAVPDLHRGRRADVRAAGHRAAGVPAADERRVRARRCSPRGPTRRPSGRCWPRRRSPNARWPRCAGGAGRSRWPSGRPGLPRCRRRCATRRAR